MKQQNTIHPLSTAGYQRLLQLQRRIHDHTLDIAREYGRADQDVAHPLWLSDYNYLTITPMRGGLHVEYFGEVHARPLAWTLECLSEQAVADTLTSLVFSGPDEGANGTREWEFTSLLDTDVTFPILRSLAIRPTAPHEHNRSQIQRAGAMMEEQGEIARFAAKAPNLSELVVPNAPDQSFFEHPMPNLHSLRIGGGYDTQAFVDNMAASSNLPNLKTLDFTESTELQFTWKAQREPDAVTSPAAYEKLFRSKAFDSLRSLYLRNTCLTLEQLEALQAIRPQLQFMVIQEPHGGYVSHFSKNVFPWRHLVQADPGEQAASDGS